MVKVKIAHRFVDFGLGGWLICERCGDLKSEGGRWCETPLNAKDLKKKHEPQQKQP